MSIPSQWGSIEDWQRIVARDVNPVLNGYPYMSLSADPSDVSAGFTYYNTTSNKVRTWDGSAWNNHW